MKPMAPIDLGKLCAHVAEARLTIEHVREQLQLGGEFNFAQRAVRALHAVNTLGESLRDAHAQRVRQRLRSDRADSASAASDENTN